MYFIPIPSTAFRHTGNTFYRRFEYGSFSVLKAVTRRVGPWELWCSGTVRKECTTEKPTYHEDVKIQH